MSDTAGVTDSIRALLLTHALLSLSRVYVFLL
jgi:hypothetical protein